MIELSKQSCCQHLDRSHESTCKQPMALLLASVDKQPQTYLLTYLIQSKGNLETCVEVHKKGLLNQKQQQLQKVQEQVQWIRPFKLSHFFIDLTSLVSVQKHFSPANYEMKQFRFSSVWYSHKLSAYSACSLRMGMVPMQCFPQI